MSCLQDCSKKNGLKQDPPDYGHWINICMMIRLYLSVKKDEPELLLESIVSDEKRKKANLIGGWCYE